MIYHEKPISDKSFLITGGAGFIGSNIVEYLINNNAKKVRVLDNFSNGYRENLGQFLGKSNFELIEGDITNFQTCREVLSDIEYVSHQAALGSVPRSIKNPLLSNEANVTGFLNMLEAARISGKVKKFVYAASSSTYGDSKKLPKKEGNEGTPLSPYAVTKLINEIYADNYSRVYNFHTTGLRYFNVFGPRQNPSNPYAAVIPIFCSAFLDNTEPTIFGDGETSRDFTYVDNAVQANIRALLESKGEEVPKHRVYNVACGEQTSLNQIISILNTLTKKNIKPIYSKERPGDVKHSLADITNIQNDLNYKPTIKFEEGIEKVLRWYQKSY